METNAESSISSSIVDQDQEELFDLIELGEKEKVETYLNTKDNPIWDYRSKDNDNSTILHVSVFKKQFDITVLFIDYIKKKNEKGLTTFINEQNDQGVTAIHYASFRGNVKIINLLIENGADIYISTKRDLNVIHYACQGNRPNSLMCFYFLLRKKNKDKEKAFSLIKKQDSGGSTPLHWAAYSSAEDVLLYLINLDIFNNENERQNFIDKKDYQGYTPLHLSVTSKSVRIVMKLLQNGATADLGDRRGRTPLDLARAKKYREIAEIIRNNQKCQCCNIKAPVKQIKKSFKNIIFIFLFQALTTFLLFISIFPIALDDNNDNIKYKIFFIIHMALLLLFFIFYISLLIKDPGVRKSEPINKVQNLLQQDEDLTKYCYKCFIQKTKTSKHCIICNKCYEDFDHHCYWINKCVAKKNYCLFLAFLIETFLYLLSLLILSIFGTIHVFNKEKEYVFRFKIWNDSFIYSDTVFSRLCIDDKKIIHIIINPLMILFDLCFLIPEAILVVLHIHVYCNNYKEKKRRITRIYSAQSIETSLMDSSEYD